MNRPSFISGFTAAIEWARKRAPMLSDDYYKANQDKLRGFGFTVSGLASIDQIERVRDSLAIAIEEGKTFRSWKKSITDDLFSLQDYRKEVVFRNGVQTAYKAGAWDGQQRVKAGRPFLMYDAINDSRTRPNHMALDGFIAPIDHPAWQKIYPPNGFNCRCSTISLDEDEAKARGWKGKVKKLPGKPDEGWDYHPATSQEKALKNVVKKKAKKYPHWAGFLKKLIRHDPGG